MNDLIKYNDGEIEIAVSIQNETIWLTQKQIAELFDKDVRTVNDHIKAIYKEEELVENSTIRKFRIVQKEGDREVARDISHYNLDMIISVGYRVNSKKATKFRQWATTILKEYPQEYVRNKNTPYYPIFTNENQEKYNKYFEYSKEFKNLVLVGRLAEYKYYDMDDIVERTLEVFEESFK